MTPISLPPPPVVQRRLRDAVMAGREEAFEAAITAGADVNGRGTAGHTLLAIAAARGDAAMTRRLIERGADPNGTGDDGRGPIHHAMERVGRNQDAVLAALIDAGANPNAVAMNQDTPMHRFLAGHVASPDTGHEDSLVSVVHRMFHAMVDHGADLRRRDAQGRLAAHVWADRPLRLARPLLETWVKQGGDPFAQDLHGRDVVTRARLHADETAQWEALARFLHAAGMERRGEQKRWVPDAPRNPRTMMGGGVPGSPLLRGRRH